MRQSRNSPGATGRVDFAADAFRLVPTVFFISTSLLTLRGASGRLSLDPIACKPEYGDRWLSWFDGSKMATLCGYYNCNFCCQRAVHRVNKLATLCAAENSLDVTYPHQARCESM